MTTFKEAFAMLPHDAPPWDEVVRWTPEALLAHADALGVIAREVASAGGYPATMRDELSDVGEQLCEDAADIALEAHGHDAALPASVLPEHVTTAVLAFGYQYMPSPPLTQETADTLIRFGAAMVDGISRRLAEGPEAASVIGALGTIVPTPTNEGQAREVDDDRGGRLLPRA